MPVLVSIIIPVYNVSQYVEACIGSVIRQDYPRLECIIVDDCSTDGSMLLAERAIKAYQGQHIVFRILRQPENRGLSEARNLALKHVAGDFVYLLDSDDEISEQCISQLVAVQERSDADVVVGSHRKVLADGTSADFVSRPSKTDIFMSCDVSWSLVACNKLVRTAFLQQHGLWFESGIYHEDILWTYQLLCHHARFDFSSAITYFYLERPSSITTNGQQQVIEKRYRSCLLVLDKMKQCLHETGEQSLGALLLLERTARMMSCMMYAAGEREKSYALFLYAKHQVLIPLKWLWRPSAFLLRQRLKLVYRLLPNKLGYGLVSAFSF